MKARDPKMSNRKHGMVGISLHLPLETLQKIQKLEGKSQSEKLRRCIKAGYEILVGEGDSLPPYPLPQT